jgi:integrase
MSAERTFDVRVWTVRTYRGKRKTTHTVRWRVEGLTFQRTFGTAKLAESFRASLIVATRHGEPFDRTTGLPASAIERPLGPTWLQHACAFVDMKWPHASPRHRKGLAEGLVTATCAAMPTGGPEPARQREALFGWCFNTAARASRSADDATAPADISATVSWMEGQAPPLAEIADPARLRPILDALAVRLDGTAASPATIARKRSALYSALDYAVELGHLPTNPMDRLKWKAPAQTDVVDRRVVVNPAQARSLLDAVGRIYPSLEAFFACMYYAALRPAEVRHLKLTDLDFPAESSTWGMLHLLGSTQTSGPAWTDDGSSTEDRQLKHRARRATRLVPMPPQLSDVLRRHLAQFPPGVGGRLFITRAGRAGVPVAPRFASPQSMGTVYRVWDAARREVLTDAEYASPLAKRPYDLRHAAVSLWLNAGVPATQVAAWAGHSVNVLLRVYASCVAGQDEAARRRVETALQIGPDH